MAVGSGADVGGGGGPTAGAAAAGGNRDIIAWHQHLGL